MARGAGTREEEIGNAHDARAALANELWAGSPVAVMRVPVGLGQVGIQVVSVQYK